GRANSALPGLQKFAHQRNWNVEFCVTNSPGDLADKARQAARAGRKRILVLGGDGTFQLLLNAVADYPQTILGIIPAGGGNDLATALGFPPDHIQSAALLLEGEVCLLDAARVRTADGNERFYAGGGGVGLDAAASRYANGAYRNLHGRSRYVLSAIRALRGFRAIRVRITIGSGEREALEATALVVGILNTPSYGAGLYLAPSAKTDDGKLELVILEDLSLLQILGLLPAFASRGTLNTKRLRRFSTTCVSIETEPPSWFHGDGELLGMTPVVVTVVPGAIRMLRPAR
ncbi:MAG TPA: YegS/Rv2252/BmrU family lipid kinase, partial [Candidatus Acidoferrum sp.]|nr:YegS/Rv2252/BmrU family lipid kinase [Candidatus Acidoferrum sp.]